MSELFIPLWRGVTEDGEIVYGYIFRDATSEWMAKKGLVNGVFHYLIQARCECNNQSGNDIPKWIRIIPESLAMQTGLKDANGVDIYGSMPGTRGGDVLSESPDCNGEVVTGEVVYNAEESGFQVNVLYEDGSVMPERLYELNNHLKIIGNAYLNPELLEVCDEG